MILDDIIDYKKIELKERKKNKPFSVLEKEIERRESPRTFLKKSEKIQLIAELKKASPSKGIIRNDFNPAELAGACEKAGACALSVLTEEGFFKGKLEYLSEVKKTVKIPVLRKDFIIDEYQILETRANGADALLLLANVLKSQIIQRYLDVSKSLGLKCLVEVHTEDELKAVLDTSADIIGINNRDLKTFKVDIKNTGKLITKISKDKVVVAESGISNRADVEYLEKIGVDAMLVGTAIMASSDIDGKIKELLGYGKG